MIRLNRALLTRFVVGSKGKSYLHQKVAIHVVDVSVHELILFHVQCATWNFHSFCYLFENIPVNCKPLLSLRLRVCDGMLLIGDVKSEARE